MLTYSVIIPAYNEEKFILQTLDSLFKQNVLPNEVIVVDDNSIDKTHQLALEYIKDKPLIKLLKTKAENIHLPGAKVIKAFQYGFENISKPFDIIVKLDADLILPPNYFDVVLSHFQNNLKAGIVGGFAYIFKNNQWVLESLTNDDHIRGAFKSYRKSCFEAIGGLTPHMGWDTLDEMLARYTGWEIVSNKTLKVKHLKPTGFSYHQSNKGKQGLVFYKLGYGFWLTLIATVKLNIKKRTFAYIFYDLRSFLKATFETKPKLVTKDQQKFIQNYRWKKIKEKIFK